MWIHNCSIIRGYDIKYLIQCFKKLDLNLNIFKWPSMHAKRWQFSIHNGTLTSVIRSSVNEVSMFIILKSDYFHKWSLYKSDLRITFDQMKVLLVTVVKSGFAIFSWRINWNHAHGPLNIIFFQGLDPNNPQSLLQNGRHHMQVNNNILHLVYREVKKFSLPKVPNIPIFPTNNHQKLV